MGGDNCKHEKYDKTFLNRTVGSLLWDHEIYICKCKDCPTEWRIEIAVGKATGWTYKSHKVEKSKCSHEHFTVDTQNMKILEETDYLKFALVFFTAHAFDGAQYTKYYVAKCKCDRCGFEFLAKAYPTMVWQNQIKVEKIVDWDPLKTRVEVSSQYKDEYVPANKF